MKLFDFLSIYFRLRAGRIAAVSFNVTDSCNCRCKMCAIWQKENGPELSLEQIAKIFKEVSDAGIKVVEITGGEPFLRRDIFEILDIMEENGLYYTINTHGGLLTPEILKRLAGYRRILDFAVSFDTLDRKTYLALRGVDQLDRVLENLKMVRPLMKNTIVKLSMTVSRLNYHEFPAILSFARSNHFYLSVFPVNLGARFEHRNEAEELIPNRQEKEDMAALFHQLARMRKSGEILCEYSKFYEGAAGYIASGDAGPCGAGKLFLDLHADGKLAVCNDLPPFADLTQTSFQQALEGVEKEAGRIRYCCASTPCYYTCSFGISHIAEHSTAHILELIKIAGVRKVWGFLFPGQSPSGEKYVPEHQRMPSENAKSIKEQ